MDMVRDPMSTPELDPGWLYQKSNKSLVLIIKNKIILYIEYLYIRYFSPELEDRRSGMGYWGYPRNGDIK